MPTTGSVSKFTPDDAYGLEHEGELEKQNAGILSQRMKVQKLSMVTMPSQKKNSASKSRDKNWDALLTKVPVKAGDFFYVPSGTMHAIGAGILILETQQSSDTTYRVYDFWP